MQCLEGFNVDKTDMMVKLPGSINSRFTVPGHQFIVDAWSLILEAIETFGIREL